MKKVAKLDTYDYIILPGVIRIKISSRTDSIMVDILSDIENSDGWIYVDGFYYSYLEDYSINDEYLELSVVLMEPEYEGNDIWEDDEIV